MMIRAPVRLPGISIWLLQPLCSCFFMVIVSAAPSFGEGARFRVVGETLFFNGDIPREGTDDHSDMELSDGNELGAYIMDYPGITTIDLRSGGGSIDAGMVMAKSITQFKLNTQVTAGCHSACAYVFLAGSKRTLKPGGILGFHRSSALSEGFRAIAQRGKRDWRADNIATVALDQGIDAGVRIGQFMLSRGIAPEFILKVLATPPHEMLEPTRTELIAAGVLDDH